MSIFKSTFKPYVIRQINTRQNLLSEVNRPVEFAHYVSSKSPWIRMTSFVDFDGSSDLAKKYILMGGSLYHMKSGGYSQRRGIGGAGAAYDGDIGTNQYGIRPMPGIAELNTRSLGAYGSLTEATVKFYAWDVKQLEDLTVLFLRPGYKVLLEWGWSMYLDTSVTGESYKKKTDSNVLKSNFTKYSIQSMPFNTIDCFDENIDQDFIYNQLDKLRHKYSGNYDGVLGSIKNYQYSLLPNGAYECTVTLISIGDVIDTIRLNDTLGYEPSPGGPAPTETSGSFNPDIKSDFEIIFDEYARLSPFKSREESPIIKAIDSRIREKDKKYIDPYVYTYGLPDEFAKQQVIPQGIFKQGGKRAYYYLQFGYVLHILNSLKNIFAKNGQTLFDIEIPSDPTNTDSLSNGLCQASYNIVSIDPSICLIRNSNATLFTSIEEDSSKKIVEVKGFRPNIYKNETTLVNGIPSPISNTKDIQEYLYSTTNFGLISNIYVNVLEIVSIYKEQSISNNGYVYLGEFISALLSKMSYSLGSINDFDKYVTDNKVVIIDKHYTEVDADSAYNSKFKVNIAGNNSIVRSHKIESKIFPSQASMIAIAAQDRENISAIQTSTYTYLNRGLTDRLLGDKTNRLEDQGNQKIEEERSKKNRLNSILKLIQYVNNYVIPNNINSDSYVSSISTMNGYLNTLLVEMEGGTNYKAVVPISVNLTVDGLSGLTIGEIFTVDKKVLPKDHQDKSIGFIVTKLASQIIGGSWTTNIESQMCILDQASKQAITKEKAVKLLGELLEQYKQNRGDLLRSISYYNLLASLVMDVLMGNIYVKNIEGNLQYNDQRPKKPFDTKTAIVEYGGSTSLGDLYLDFQNSYNNLYPLTTETKTFQRESGQNVTKDVVKYGDIIVKETRTTKLNDPNVTNVIQSKFVKISDNVALPSIIKNMSLYKEMEKTPQIKGLFDNELGRVMTVYNNGDILKTDTTVVSNVTGPTQGGIVRFRSTQELIFYIIDSSKAIDATGFLNPQTSDYLIEGYKYY